MTATLDHKALVASVDAETKKRLTRKSDLRGLIHLAAHLGLIGALGAAVASDVPGWQVLILPLGVLIIFCFTLMHECTHRTPFATGWLNDWVMRICGVLLILPPEWFRYFHFAHHRHTNDPENDPELASGPKPEKWAAYLWAISGAPVWRSQIAQLLTNAAGRCDASYVPASAASRIRFEACVMLVVYVLVSAAVAAGQAWILWCWALPLIVGQPFLRLYLMAEHGRCPAVANMLENSRTTFTNRVVRFIAWNMPYHAEHHAWPTVPFHQLPALHALAAPQLRSTSEGYAAFHGEMVGALR
ncbi:MAG: fatty acid desaturase [Pseudomonadota bacterium]